MTLEPTAILYSVLAALNAAQQIAAPIPGWAHAIILVATAAVTAFVNRSQVSPA